MSSLHQGPTSALSAAGRIHALRILSRTVGVGGVGVILGLVVIPWQQSVRGTGRVIAYAPLERQQAVEAPIEGRVVHWHVQEGDRVEQGDPIADLADNDPEILGRLARERDAAQAQVDAGALSISLTETRIASMEAARASAITNARLQVQMATDRRHGYERAVDAARATLKTAQLNLERQSNLHAKGLASKRDLELAELAEETGRADLDRAQASLRAASADVKALSAEQARIASSNQAGIESIQSSLQNVIADRSKAEAELAKVEVRMSRQEQMQVKAPRSGTILRIVAKQGTEMVKAGDPLVLLVPTVGSNAVELFVDGNDAPLIDKNRPVRLQFEGWPAVQFVGWPSVAVGTFGGTVAFVDSHDDGRGRFRVVVVPDEADPWPDSRYLRQGVRANGWVLLNRVRLGFELWRRFNGFPPAIALPSQTEQESGRKAP